MHSSRTAPDYYKWWININNNTPENITTSTALPVISTPRPYIWPNATRIPTSVPPLAPTNAPLPVPTELTPSIKFNPDGSIIIEGVGMGLGGIFVLGLLVLGFFYM